MPKTEIGKRKSYYQRLFNEQLNDNLKSEEYKNVLSSLKSLVDLTDNFDTEKTAMTTEQYKNTVNHYTEVLENCRSYLRDPGSNNNTSKARIVNRIAKTLMRDYEVFKTMDAENPGKYSDAVVYARATKINVTGKKLDKMGGSLSSRIPMKINDGTKGFFTPISYYDNDLEWRYIVQNYVLLFSEEGARRIIALLHNTDARNKLAHSMSKIKTDEKTAVINAMKALGYPEKEIQEASETGSGRDWYALKTLLQESFSTLNVTGIYDFAGIPIGSRTDQRNAAMSTVAELIGCNDIIAKSHSVVVVVDGKKTYGTFMESAEGMDLNTIKEGDPILELTTESIRTPEFYRQVSDLQALDYICGNPDRHIANIIYTVDKSNPPKIIGVKGIDNDLSFGSRKYETTEDSVMRLAHPEDMGLLSKSTAEKILSIETKDMLKISLQQYGFNEQELSAAWSRLKTMQQTIKDNKITLLNDNDWEDIIQKINSEEITLPKRSRLIRLEKDILNRKKYLEDRKNHTNIFSNKQISYVPAESGGLKVELESRNSEIHKMVMSIKHIDLHLGSKEFDAMRDSLYNLGKQSSLLVKNLADGIKPTTEQVDKLNTLYDDVSQKTTEYIAKKKLEPSSSRGRMKLSFATVLQDMLLDTPPLNVPEKTSENEMNDTEELKEK